MVVERNTYIKDAISPSINLLIQSNLNQNPNRIFNGIWSDDPKIPSEE